MLNIVAVAKRVCYVMLIFFLVSAQSPRGESPRLPEKMDFSPAMTSKYLGKAYKKCGRHKPFPKVEDPRVFSSKVFILTKEHVNF